MKSSQSHEALRQFLAAAAADQIAPGPHVADDDELLESWAAGYLGSDRIRALHDHLAVCPPCATLVAQMVKSGVLVPPRIKAQAEHDTAAASVRSSNTRRQTFSRSQRPWLLLASLSFAATVVAAMLTFGGRSNSGRPNSSEQQLAMAQSEVARGAHLEALGRIEQLLGRGVAEPLRAAARAVAREAAEKAAGEYLERGEYPQVSPIVTRGEQLGVATDRLLNADLQAKRGEPAIDSLARAGTLLDYGYGLGGQALQKAFPTFDAAFEHQRQQWNDALRRYPQSALLRVNYGQFLLKSNAIAAAEEQFQEVLVQLPESLDARLGRGLARYERQDYAGALDDFQAVLRLRPQSTAAASNAALASESLRRKEDANRYWRQALPLVTDPKLRDDIEAHLRESLDE